MHFLLVTRHASMFEDMAQPQINQEMSDPGPKLGGTTTTLLVLAFFFVVLRFAARFKRGLTYGADDWMIVVSVARTSASLTSSSDSLLYAWCTVCLLRCWRTQLCQ